MKVILYAWLAAFGVILTVYLGVSSSHEKIQKRLVSMEKTVTDAQTFRERLDRMRPVAKQFEQALPQVSNARDVFTIYELIGFSQSNLQGSPERLSVGSVEKVRHNAKEIGVVSLCVSNSGGPVSLNAADLQSAVDGLDGLLSKPWLTAGEVTIEVSPGRPEVKVFIQGLCGRMRADA